jgi:hypothetical protein
VFVATILEYTPEDGSSTFRALHHPLTKFHTHRWDDLDTSPVTWHIVPAFAGDVKRNGADFDPFVTEPWQSAVNGIY